MKLDPNKILSVPLTIYEATVVLNQLRSSLPSPGDQMAIVNVTTKLRKAIESET